MPGKVPATVPRKAPDDVLAERYGVRRAGRRPAVLAAVVLAGAATAWFVWATPGIIGADVRTRDVGFRVVDDGATEVTFDVTKDVAATATCLVRALDATFGEVGLAEVTIGPADARTVRSTARVPTSTLATSGGVKECTLQR